MLLDSRHYNNINMAAADRENEADPIVGTYDIYIKPQISDNSQVYILQFPNRDARSNYSQSHDAQPSKLRVKENAGMVEVDVPIDAWENYDRHKGVQWGQSLNKSSTSKGTGSHGLPGGFGIGGSAGAGRGRGRGADLDEATHDRLIKDFARSIDTEAVLVKQTLGGQYISNEETTPRYMIGAFRKGIV